MVFRPIPPLTPGEEGRFDGYDVLSQTWNWDEVTAGVVLDRLSSPPPPAYFTREEEPVARALFDVLLAQHEEPKVPVFELVDRRLAVGETDGWRYADMPEDSEIFRLTVEYLDADAHDVFDCGFAELSPRQQGALIQRVQDLDEDKWHDLTAKHVWSLWTRYVCAAFYSHPWAWNEIGFGGPAYPRGYKHIGFDAREPWETTERDAHDPVPWANKVKQSKHKHAQDIQQT